MKKSLQVTLSDIARKLDVSKVTVSKALRGHPDISAETVRKVKKLAREVGYFPNYMARNLSSRRSNTIGVVVPKGKDPAADPALAAVIARTDLFRRGDFQASRRPRPGARRCRRSRPPARSPSPGARRR